MSAEPNHMEISVEEAARMLAVKHCEDDEGTEAVYWFPDEGVVRLLETTTNVPASGEIFPMGYKARRERGLPYAIEIVLVHPDELEAIKGHTLELPERWGAFDKALKLYER
jgi:hypothetical protein